VRFGDISQKTTTKWPYSLLLSGVDRGVNVTNSYHSTSKFASDFIFDDTLCILKNRLDMGADVDTAQADI
jgi:hypothetical protein